MIRANVFLEDMDGFDAQLDLILDAIAANLKEVATIVRDEAQSTSAFADKTGKLRKSIRLKRISEEEYEVYTRAPHAHLVEFGHVKIAWGNVTGERVPPHQYMRPSVDKGIQRAIVLFRGQ